MINPRHLRAFSCVARTGSIAHAAKAMHRVPSSLTHAIKELETRLAVPLFERRPHGMLLTDFGKILRVRVENVFQEMQTARQLLQALAPDLNAKAAVFSLNLGKQRLCTLVELIKHGHMGAVADLLGISQPSVSQTLRDMEMNLNMPLVCRTPCGLVATPGGTVLATHVQHVLTEMAWAEEEIVSARHGMSGHVQVGTLSLGRSRLLPQAIIHTLRAHPGIGISTTEGSFEYLAKLLRSTEIDFILGGLRATEQMVGLSVRPLVSSRLLLLARRGHPWQKMLPAQGWPLFAQAQWVLPPHGTWTRTSLQAGLAAQRLPVPRIVVETADLTLIKELLLGSDMLTAASSLLFQHEIETGELVVLPLQLLHPARDMGLVLRTGSTPSVAARLLIDAIVAGA